MTSISASVNRRAHARGWPPRTNRVALLLRSASRLRQRAGRTAIAAAAYIAAAAMITDWIPYESARSIAATALITDAEPLIAHAQGIQVRCIDPKYVIPSGNGMPMSTAIGATISSEATTLAASGADARSMNA